MNSPRRNSVLLFVAIVLSMCFLRGGRAQAFILTQEAQQWADQTLATLTLEQKIAQIICCDIAGGYISEEDPKFQHWVELARDHGIGGFVLYGGTPRDVAHLLNRLQHVAKLPILISADFEGGPGQQVTGASEFPGNMGFAAAGSEDLMYEAAKVMGTEGRAIGVHLTYTPVVDISVRPDNPQESVRSFGGNLDLLGRLVRAYVRGYHDVGMLTSAKHFPGRGDVRLMPDFPGFRYNDKPTEKMVDQEFRAFKQAIDAGVDYVMTEHIAVPSVTGGSNLPASVEKKLVTGWLRNRLGFEGIITTDDLWYDHVCQRFGAVDVAIKALEAGHDIILKPKDPVATIQGVAEAVRSGRLTEARIDESVRKLLVLKARLGLHKYRLVDEDRIGTLVGTPEHLAVVQKVADQSITLLKNDDILPVSSNRLGKIVNINIQKSAADLGPATLAKKLTVAFPGIRNYTSFPDMDPALYDQMRSAAAQADLVILSLFVQRTRETDPTPIREADLALIEQIIKAKPKAVIAMSYGNPHLIRKIGDVPAFMVGYGEGGWYGNQTVYFDSFIKVLKGQIKPQGKLPIEVSDRYPIGSGLSY